MRCHVHAIINLVFLRKLPSVLNECLTHNVISKCSHVIISIRPKSLSGHEVAGNCCVSRHSVDDMIIKSPFLYDFLQKFWSTRHKSWPPSWPTWPWGYEWSLLNGSFFFIFTKYDSYYRKLLIKVRNSNAYAQKAVKAHCLLRQFSHAIF
jgi:hypothetical protein